MEEEQDLEGKKMDTPKAYWKRMTGWVVYLAGLLVLCHSIATQNVPEVIISLFLLIGGLYAILKGTIEEFQ